MANTAPTRPAMVDALTLLRPAALWPAIVARLEPDPELRAILGGARRWSIGRATPFTRAKSTAWSRGAVVPVVRAFEVAAPPPPAPRELAFLVRVDTNDLRHASHGHTLEAAHARVYRLLCGWTPVVSGLRVVLPIWLDVPPDLDPFRDDESQTLYTSAVYRCEAVPAPLT